MIPRKHTGKLVTLLLAGSTIAYALNPTQGEIGAINAMERHWENNQFEKYGEWSGFEDSTGTLQSILYTTLMRGSSADTTLTPLIDVDFIMALADQPPLDALQRRAVSHNYGAVLEGTTGVDYADSLEAEDYYDINLTMPHIPTTSIQEPSENPNGTMLEITCGYIRRLFSR